MIFLRGLAVGTLLLAGVETCFGVERMARTPYVGAIVVDAADGRVLFEDRADERGYPASVTKLVTLAVVLDRVDAGAIALDGRVTITAESARIGGSQVYLKQGESFTVDELLYALMISSANDAAMALAIHVAGSREAFVALMNEKARALGMASSTFHSPHGLPPSKGQQPDISTARDLARLSQSLVRRSDVLRYTSVRIRSLREQTANPFVMTNHNNLLGRLAGCDGLKTGYFHLAGSSIAATAQRDGRRLIAVVLGSEGSKARDLKTMELVEQGFATMARDAPAAKAPPPTPSDSTRKAEAADVPVVRTDKTAPTEQTSTPEEPVIKFTPPTPKEKAMNLPRRLDWLFLLFVAAMAAPLAHAQRERLPPEDREIVEQRWPNAKRTATSLRYVVVKEGDQGGEMPKPGARVKVLYKGMLLDGTVFDEAQDPAQPFNPRVGRGELIDGWEQALTRMHRGEKWILIVPYELGYGSKGSPPKIPRRATLVFEMELVDFEGP